MWLYTPKAGRRKWLGLAVLALPCLLIAIDASVLNLAVPAADHHARLRGERT